MKCPNCRYELSDGTVCPSCGVDSILYIKTVKISDTLYNEGLMRAKTQDLSGAMDCLVKSIEINKNNITARNLLGLIHFEIGHVGEALKQWIISSSMLKERNPAAGYIENVQKSGRTMEKYNDAIRMYNQALVYINQKSDDMAVIQLKKAVECNPKFIDALNLYTFCCLIQQDKDKALSCIEKVMAIDANNVIALNYYHELYPSKTRPDHSSRIKKVPQPVTQIQPPSFTRLASNDRKSFGNTFHVAEILSFLAGGLCGFAIVYILWMPSAVNAKDIIIAELTESKATAEQTLNRTIEESQEEITRLQEENERLTRENQETNDQVIRLDKTQKATVAISLYNEGKMEDAAMMFYSLDVSGLDQGLVETVQEMKADSFDKTSQALYNQAVKDYNARRYDDAKANLEKATQFLSPDASYADGIIYYSGLIAEENSDVVSAKRYYQSIVDNYPNSQQLRKAQNRLRALEEE